MSDKVVSDSKEAIAWYKKFLTDKGIFGVGDGLDREELDRYVKAVEERRPGYIEAAYIWASRVADDTARLWIRAGVAESDWEDVGLKLPQNVVDRILQDPKSLQQAKADHALHWADNQFASIGRGS